MFDIFLLHCSRTSPRASLGVVLTVLCLLFTENQLCAQNNLQHQIARADSFIANAELLICEHKPELALQQYGEAFRIYGSKMSSRNLYHYFISAFDFNAENEARLTLNILKCRGWRREAFIKFLSLFYDEEQMKGLKQLYDDIGLTGCSLDQESRAKIDSLVYNDWKVNKRFQESRAQEQKRAEVLSEFKQITIEHIQALAALGTSHYLTDDFIGRMSPLSDPVYDIILLHQAELQGWRSSWGSVSHFYEQLFRGIALGCTDADEFEQYVSSPAAFDRNIFHCKIDDVPLTFPLNNRLYFRINDSLYEWIRDGVSPAEYNRRRKAVPGLGDVAFFRKRFVFQFYNPKYRFVSNVYLLNLSPIPDSLRKHLNYINPLN